MKIVDCFTFYNELDILEYRLELLYPFVDHFVLVEATRTHVGKEKPLFFNENKTRFSKYMDKIIHVIDDELNPNPHVDTSKYLKDEVWKNENHQRDSIDKGIQILNLNPDDLLIISDVDEIPNIMTIYEILETKHIHYANLIQDMYYYNLTCKQRELWCHAKIVCYHIYVNNFNCSPQACRNSIINSFIHKGGWHLSYFGNSLFIQNKLKQFAHQEYNQEKYTSIENIEENMKNRMDLFDRREVDHMIYIPIEKNNNLPPLYEKYLSKYMG